MSSEFSPSTLGKVLNFSNGKSSPERLENGKYHVYGANGEIGLANENNSPSDTIVVGRVGSYCGAVHFSNSPCWVTDNAIKATAKDDNDPLFLFYLLKQLNLNNWRSGSGQPLINQSTLNSINVQIPSPSTQAKIGLVIGSLDRRIALLRETNATLESIAQALFKSWFVDFDPVRAKQQDQIPEGMDEATAALFPDSFEESELGLIPSGWRVCRIEEIMELAYGKALKSTDRIDGPVPVYGSGGITGYHNAHLVVGPSIIVGRKGTVGTLYWEDWPFFPIDTVFFVKSELPLTYCFYLLQTLGLQDMNTDAAVPGLNRNNVYRLKVAIPSEPVLSAFNGIVERLRDRIFNGTNQAHTLTSIRDALLPRLISGQLRMTEAEDAVEEVAA